MKLEVKDASIGYKKQVLSSNINSRRVSGNGYSYSRTKWLR